MFVDELTIHAKAGSGGDGVVRWLREKGKPWGGPAGGNGGNGGSVFVRAVRDVGLLERYVGTALFAAKNGEAGSSRSQYGKHGEDKIIDVPVGSIITRLETGERFELFAEGEEKKILSGGRGGLGNEHFKSSTNRSPQDATRGRVGEEGTFRIELELVVDVGFVGLPNAGKSSILNALTNARSRVGAYPFTTLEPHLGDLFGFILADIPGLIEGAASGKGLGHKFLRHVRRTNMLVYCVSCEDENPLTSFETVRTEIAEFDPAITTKPAWILLTKTDLVDTTKVRGLKDAFSAFSMPVHAVSIYDDGALKTFADALTQTLREGRGSATIRTHE